MSLTDHPAHAPRCPALVGVHGDRLTRATASHGSGDSVDVGSAVAHHDATSSTSSLGDLAS